MMGCRSTISRPRDVDTPSVVVRIFAFEQAAPESFVGYAPRDTAEVDTEEIMSEERPEASPDDEQPTTGIAAGYDRITLDGDIADWVREHLIPTAGPADNVQGELLRAVGNLRDESHRNGNANWGQRHEKLIAVLEEYLCSASPLSDEQQRRAGKALDKFKGGRVHPEDNDYDSLEELVVEVCRAHPELIAYPEDVVPERSYIEALPEPEQFGRALEAVHNRRDFALRLLADVGQAEAVPEIFEALQRNFRHPQTRYEQQFVDQAWSTVRSLWSLAYTDHLFEILPTFRRHLAGDEPSPELSALLEELEEPLGTELLAIVGCMLEDERQETRRTIREHLSEDAFPEPETPPHLELFLADYAREWFIDGADSLPVSASAAELVLRLVEPQDGAFVGTTIDRETLQFRWEQTPEGLQLLADFPSSDDTGEVIGSYNGYIDLDEAQRAIEEFADQRQPPAWLVEQLQFEEH